MTSSKIHHAGAALALALGVAHAQEARPPATLTREGTIAQVLVDPHGAPDGLWLADGTVVRFPPHAVFDPEVLRVGMAVRAEGEPATTPSGITLFGARVSTGGYIIADASRPAPPPTTRFAPPHGPDGDLRPISARGRVRAVLANPDGAVDGFILDDGTVVQAEPRARLSRFGIAAGSQVTATGLGGSYPQGRSMRVLTLQIGDGATYAVEHPAPRPAP
jgi:hypothetical protein